jgi:hypothetical protein
MGATGINQTTNSGVSAAILMILPKHESLEEGCHCVYKVQYHPTVGFEALTSVDMKSSSFWHITPCSLLKANQRSEEAHSGSKNMPSKIPA